MADRYLLESGSPDGYKLEDGSGVYLLDFIAIVNNVGTQVAVLGGDSYRITKTAGASAYDADAVGVAGFAGDFLLRLSQASAFNGNWFGGMATAPLTDSNFTSMEYSLLSDNANWYVFESSVNIGSPVALSTYGWIWRSGTNLNYGAGATFDIAATTGLIRTVPGVTATLYFDSSFHDTGTITDVYLTDTVPTLASAALTGQAISAALGSVVAVVSPALAGQGITAARGTLTPTAATALTGQSLTAARGTVLQGAPLVGQAAIAAQGSTAASISIALTGQSVGAAQGSVAASPSLALSGQGAIASRGSVLAAPSIGISGLSLSAAQGSLTAGASLALTGQSLTAARGTVTAAAADVTLALTGQSLSVARGSVAPIASKAITGQAIVAARGSVAGSSSRSLTGQSGAVSSGSIVAASGTVLAGQGITASRGTIIAGTPDVTVALTGVAAIMAQGYITAQAITSLTRAEMIRNRRRRQGHVEYEVWHDGPEAQRFRG